MLLRALCLKWLFCMNPISAPTTLAIVAFPEEDTVNDNTTGVTLNNAQNFDDRSSRPIWLGEDHRGWDHVRIHRTLIIDPRLKADHMAVYMGLALHAETQTGDCRPAAETLGTYIGRGEKFVRKLLTELEEWRYIDITTRPGKASVFRLLPPPDLSPPRSVGPGSFSPPRSVSPRTPVPGPDELEPRTRLNNSSVENFTRARSTASVDNSGRSWLLQRDEMIREGRGCSPCEATGIRVDDDTGIAEQCTGCDGSGISRLAAVR